MTDVFSEFNNVRNVFPELSLVQCGWESCESNYSFGPAVRDYILIHYVTSGSGIFYKNNEQVRVSTGGGFVIFPGEVTTYTADPDDPWHYYWLGFSGDFAQKILDSKGITQKNRTFNAQMNQTEIIECIQKLYMNSNLSANRDISSLSLLLNFLALISGEVEYSSIQGDIDSIQEKYLQAALIYINEQYSKEITVQQVATHIGVDRTYLFRIFKQYIGVSPQNFILNVRLKRVCKLLVETPLQIKVIAEQCGFSSTTHLNVAFRRVYLMSPGEYRSSSSVLTD